MTTPLQRGDGRAIETGRAARLMRLGVVSGSIPRARVRIAGPKPEPVPELPFSVPVNLLGKPGWKTILRLVALKHGTTPAAILAKADKKTLSAARFELSAKLWSHTALSLPQIGFLLERDHTTILHGVRKWEEAESGRQDVGTNCNFVLSFPRYPHIEHT